MAVAQRTQQRVYQGAKAATAEQPEIQVAAGTPGSVGKAPECLGANVVFSAHLQHQRAVGITAAGQIQRIPGTTEIHQGHGGREAAAVPAAKRTVAIVDQAPVHRGQPQLTPVPRSPQ